MGSLMLRAQRNDNNPDEDPSLNLPRTKNNHNQHKNNHRRKNTRKQTNLTRFGLNAYVLGAIRREINLLGRILQWLAASLNARELQPFPSQGSSTRDTNPKK